MTSPETSSASRPTAGEHGVDFHFENTYARLPERFYARVAPTPVPSPRLLKLNLPLAEFLGLDPDQLASPEGVEILAGNRIAAGSEPLAEAYAGHQFGHFVQLGDGRANLLGEVVARDGARYDIQLKGSGPTPFSRRGDGRAAVGPVLREYIVSEAMAAMGIPTTRSLAAVATGEQIMREIPLPGAVLTRVAASHLRVGTFEYFAAQGDIHGVRTLADYAIDRHYPEAAQAPQRYRAFLDGVVTRQARLVAQWMMIGLVHGVMNTDNTSISGETIDYGPCAFLEAYHPATVFSSIDRHGRYAYGNQPRILLWNLTRLAEALMPVLIEESGSPEAALKSATESLEAFAPQYEAAQFAGLRQKLGVLTAQDDDLKLAQDLLERMAANEADFTLTFRRLSDAATGDDARVRTLFTDPASFDEWAVKWRARIACESATPDERASAMRRVNPIYIPRNHMVEAALNAAVMRNDLRPFEDLLEAISQPYDERSGLDRFAIPARPEERVCTTFCGT